MDLKERLSQDLLKAMKAKETVTVSTLRLAISALRNKEIERSKTFTDADVLDVLQSEAKTRRESMAAYLEAARPDLTAKEEEELKVLQTYLPEMLSDEQLRELVQAAIQSVGASGPRDMGKVMSALMPQI